MKEIHLVGCASSIPAHLSLQLLLCPLEILDEQVLACELIVVGEVVDALPVVQVHLVQLMVDPPAECEVKLGTGERSLNHPSWTASTCRFIMNSEWGVHSS